MNQHTYITTPIYYVNDRPHIGHCYTTTVADAFARLARLRGTGPVFFLTGTDEHADKVVTNALANKFTPIQWADKNAEQFKLAFAFMGATNDDFIRTTQERHTSRVRGYIAALIKSGDIYLGDYSGWYDPSQEEYLTETVAKDAGFVSPVTGQPLIKRTEKNYFFNLAKYEQRLLQHIEAHKGFIQPESRRNEVLGRLRDGLQPVPVSRAITDDPATQFGIRIPGDDSHRIYVWIDALFNYLSTIDTDDRRAFWPPVHFLAKDILWFHAVVWPALLMALHDADPKTYSFVKLPRAVYAHSYWVREGRKMSKSLGNFVEIETLRAYADKYSLDAVRWYLLTQGPLGSTDADFSHAKFVEIYNANLANGLGNCASRVANMIGKYFAGQVPAPAGPITNEVESFAAGIAERYLALADELNLDAALALGTGLISKVDQFINDTQPFKLAKTIEQNPAARDRLGQILYICAEAIRIATVLLSPAIPGKAAHLFKAWGLPALDTSIGAAHAPLTELARFGGDHALKPGHRLIGDNVKPEPLFLRADPAEAPPA
jgi:methionyl-tRNA synthetase